MTVSASALVIDTLARVAAAAAPRQKPLGDALGTHLRRVGISGPVETFEGEIHSGPFQKVDFRMNVETNVGVLVLNLRKGAPGLREAQLEAAWRLSPEPATRIRYPDIPPEGAISHIYKVGTKEVHLQYGALSNRLLVAAVHWNGEP
jgi:hypothetical protein